MLWENGGEKAFNKMIFFHPPIIGNIHGSQPQRPGGVLLPVSPLPKDHELQRNVSGVLQKVYE